eukprot:scaffold1348_cov142-Skeletonema_marinoi.AAC.1
MVPYSLSACQVVRVICAVLRALGTSPIMALGIVFLTGYPTCARPLPPLLFCAPRRFSKIFLRLAATKQPCCDGMFRAPKRQPLGVIMISTCILIPSPWRSE